MPNDHSSEKEDPGELLDRKLTRRQMLALSGLALPGILLAGCGGGSLVHVPAGGSGKAGRLVVNPKANTLTNDRGVQVAFLGFLTAPNGALAAFWGTQDSEGVPLRLTQTLYWDASPLNGVRVLFDGQGLPVRVEHEENGAFVLIFWESNKATLKFYQPDGTYIGGAVVTGTAPQYDVTQLPDSQVVGYFSGRINGLTDAIITFTIGGTTTAAQSRSKKVTTRSAVSRDANLTPEEFTQAKKIVDALATRASETQSGFAGALLKAIAEPLLATGNSELGSRIISTALEGTGVSPLFLQDGLPILYGLATPSILRSSAEKMSQQLKDATTVPDTLGVAYSSPAPVDYRAGVTFKTTRPASDPTGIRGIVASREYNIISVTGYIDTSGQVYLSGTSANGDLIELTGTVQNGAVSDGIWTVKTSPAASRDSGGSWDAQETPLGQCTEQQNSGGQGIFSNTYDLGKCGDFSFRYQAYSIPDQFQIFQDDNLIFDTGGKVSGSATVTVTAVGQTTLIRVVVTADLRGTAWNYTVGCPD